MEHFGITIGDQHLPALSAEQNALNSASPPVLNFQVPLQQELAVGAWPQGLDSVIFICIGQRFADSAKLPN
jgi:hypothetical protein